MKCCFKIEGYDVYRFEMPLIKSNMYILHNQNEVLMIDPQVSESASSLLKSFGIDSITILLTHEHYDHIAGVNYYRKDWKCEVIASEKCGENTVSSKGNLSAYFMAMFVTNTEEEREVAKQFTEFDYCCEVDTSFQNKYSFKWGDLIISLLETPGHSEGSICILINDKYIFTGDSLIPNEKVITRLPGGDRKKFLEITRPFLEKLPDDMIVFPGHGIEEVKSSSSFYKGLNVKTGIC